MVVSVTSAYSKATAVYQLKVSRGSQNLAAGASPAPHNGRDEICKRWQIGLGARLERVLT
jgi:hypothetical protein